MNRNITCAVVAIWLMFALAISAEQAGSASAPAAGSKRSDGNQVNPDAKLIAEFRAKVDDYVRLRNRLADKAPPLKETDDPKLILQAEEALADQVRAARADARRGDFFTPAVQMLFRRLLKPAVTGPEGRENIVAISDDAPEPTKVPFKVNASYPTDQPLSTVPPAVLLSLPTLPQDIQYRFVGRHLILYDAKPNIIVDYMVNALPPVTPLRR